MAKFIGDYWLASLCVVGTYALFNVVVGIPWYGAVLCTVVAWGLAMGLCMHVANRRYDD